MREDVVTNIALPMAANKRTPFQREADLFKTQELYLRGKTQQEIADELDVSREQIKYDLKAIQQRWQETTTFNLDEAKAKELSKVDNLERTYWEAWERTLGERTKSRVERQGAGETTRDKSSIERESLLGDPRFLQGVQWCIERRCDILGLYAPKRQIYDFNMKDLSEEQLERLSRGEDIDSGGFTGKSRA
jgi:multidrug efflux pump subunit AcrA (membrane-fusion protein)